MIVPCLYVILLCNLILVNAVLNGQFVLKFQNCGSVLYLHIFVSVQRVFLRCTTLGLVGNTMPWCWSCWAPVWRTCLTSATEPFPSRPSWWSQFSWSVWSLTHMRQRRKKINKYWFQHIAYIYHRSHGWSLCTQEVWSTGTLSPRIFWWVGQGPKGNIRSTSSTLGLPKNTSTLRPKNTSLTGSTRA